MPETPDFSQWPTGWIKDPAEVDRIMGLLPMPTFGQSAPHLAGDGAGKVVLLYEAVRKVVGHDLIHEQQVGDCVSHGFGLGADVVACVQIATGAGEEWGGEAATEVIYAGSRVEVGGGRIGGDGSVGAWAAKWVQDYGVVVRKQYGSINLATYSGQRAREWGRGRAGVPDELEPIAREHPIKTASLVETYEQARDSLANGYPVAVCSNRGFQQRRDADGFARPSGSWAHCMCFIGIDDSFKRPGALCQNSWGSAWISGPKRHEQPEGSFWVDADTVTQMLRERDSFALSSFVGFPARDLPDFRQY